MKKSISPATIEPIKRELAILWNESYKQFRAERRRIARLADKLNAWEARWSKQKKEKAQS